MSHETENRVEPSTNRVQGVPDLDSLETRDLVFPEKKARTDRTGRVKLWVGLGTGAAVLLGGLYGVGQVISNKSEAPEPSVEPTIDAPAVPGGDPAETPNAEPTDTETEPSVVNELEPIPADASAEVLAQQTNDLFLEWVYSNATKDTAGKVYDSWIQMSDISLEDYANNLAQQSADRYASVLFPSTWSENPETVQYYDDYIAKNANNIQRAVAKHISNEPIPETVLKVANIAELEAPEGQRIINYHLDGENINSDEEYIDRDIIETYDISDGTARLIRVEVVG